jgi:gingipain R
MNQSLRILVVLGFLGLSGCERDPVAARTGSIRTELLPGPAFLDLEVTPPACRIRTVQRSGVMYSVIEPVAGLVTKRKGFARLPFASAAIQLPGRQNVRIESRASDVREIQLTHPLLPSRGTIYRYQRPSEIPYAIAEESVTDTWYPGELSTLSAPYIFRDVRGATLFVFPYQYNAKHKRLRFHGRIRVRLELTPDGQVTNPLPERIGVPVQPMPSIYRSVFANYHQTKGARIGELGQILVIHTARDAEAIKPYIQWKREKGLPVHVREVAPGTQVQSMVTAEYQANDKILYVQLVGDWEDLKSPRESGYPGDPMLGCVAGNDDFPDLIVGRFSANHPDQVKVQVEKSIQYERAPQRGASWYSRGLGIASDEGPGDDGEMDYEHMDVIKEYKLTRFTYSEVAEAYRNPSTASLVQQIQDGLGIINYIGHGWEQGWVTGDLTTNRVSTLTNGEKLPFIISVACLTGLFDQSSDCLGEAFLKQSGGGAVAAVMSSIYQPWQPPMRGQDYMNDLLIGGYDYDNNPGRGQSFSEGRTTFGSIVFNGLCLMYAESPRRDDLLTIRTWTLFGDSSLQVRTDTPREIALSSTHAFVGVPFETRVESNGQPVDQALLCLSQGDLAFIGTTDAAGSISISHTLEPGPARLVVTGFNLDTMVQDLQVRIPVLIESISLAGSASDDDPFLLLLANGKEVAIDRQGQWEQVFTLPSEGLKILLELIDPSGNRAGESISLSVDPVDP